MASPLPRPIAALAARYLLPATAALVLLSPAARAQCVGDCNDNDAVSINELIVAVNIALGERPAADCTNADPSGDGTIAINELVRCVGSALNGCDPVEPSPTPEATSTSAPTATPAAAVGPVIHFFTLTTSDDGLIDPTGEQDGIPVFELPQGRAFHIVIEAGRGTSGADPGLETFSQDGVPALQVAVSRPLGDGSAAVCDAEPPFAGGVPPIHPPSFDTGDQAVVDALNDIGCRFQDGGGTMNPVTSGRGCGNACVRFSDGEYACVDGRTVRQYCSTDITDIEEFPVGDTLVTARVMECRRSASCTQGEDTPRPGPIEQIIIRVATPFPG